jgi:8-oxo-dGTP pyrophosphatase MutT (NUDIX family)
MIKYKASILIIINKQWKILLQDRAWISKIWEKWAVFWWGVELWEKFYETLIREIKEELNIDLEDWKNNFRFICSQKFINTARKNKVKCNYYALITDKEEKDFTVLEWAWCKYFSLEEARKNITIWDKQANFMFFKWIEKTYNYYLQNYGEN